MARHHTGIRRLRPDGGRVTRTLCTRPPAWVADALEAPVTTATASARRRWEDSLPCQIWDTEGWRIEGQRWEIMGFFCGMHATSQRFSDSLLCWPGVGRWDFWLRRINFFHSTLQITDHVYIESHEVHPGVLKTRLESQGGWSRSNAVALIYHCALAYCW